MKSVLERGNCITVIHGIYVVIGKLINHAALVWWRIRDRFFPPETDAVLLVAHPDDDALFFHSFIKERKPYVCLMTTGWSLRRMSDFKKCMRHYGVKYRAYPLKSKDDRVLLIEKHVKSVLKMKYFSVVATHNATGEYGHEEHIRVHEAVVSVLKKEKYRAELLCPVDVSEIKKYSLPDDISREKLDIFANVYVTESWVPFEEEAGTPIWVTHEKLKEKKY